MPTISGLHHVTAIAGDAQKNVDFYSGVLGLRLVKVTVNYDDPSTYHFYYGSGSGAPGTILTFFPWAAGYRGTRGTGETSVVALSIPLGASEFWRQRLTERGIVVATDIVAEGEPRLHFADPDGMQIELVATAGLSEEFAWGEGPVELSKAIHGIHHVVLDIAETDVGETVELLEGTLGFQKRNTVSERLRFDVDAGGPSRWLEIKPREVHSRGRMGPGSVHHIAWRTPTDEQQLEWLKTLRQAGQSPTPVQDRQYFHSIYFREPGGVLFEIATDPPGFMADESYAELGSSLRLPEWLEPQRARIAASLPKFERRY